MIVRALTTLVGVVLMLAGLFLLMFNDLGKPTWMAASFVLMGGGLWMAKRSNR